MPFAMHYSQLELRIKSGDMEKLENSLCLPNNPLMCDNRLFWDLKQQLYQQNSFLPLKQPKLHIFYSNMAVHNKSPLATRGERLPYTTQQVLFHILPLSTLPLPWESYVKVEEMVKLFSTLLTSHLEYHCSPAMQKPGEWPSQTKSSGETDRDW